MFLDSIGMCTSAATLFILRHRGEGDAQVTGALAKYTPYLAAFFVLSYAMVAVAVVIPELDERIKTICSGRRSYTYKFGASCNLAKATRRNKK